jgi:predicted amidohydrolase YtcJ
MKLSRFHVLIAATAATSSVFASDTILIHGHIYTANDKMPWVQGLAITAGRIEAAGPDAEILKHKDSNTNVIDLSGRAVIPGVSDAHTHTWFGALALHGFNLATPDLRITPDDGDALVAKIKDYATSHLKDKVLFGRVQFSTAPDSPATRQLLDRAVSDRPVVVHNTSEHSLWVNSKALALAGVTKKPVADPLEEKYVVRDSTGEPTGVLVDPAMQLIVRALPSPPLEEKLALLRDAAHYLNSFGITSVNNATGSLAEMQAYAALNERGQLTIRTRTAFAEVSVNHHLTPQFLADLDKARSLYHDNWVAGNLVKFFADGAGSTTALLEPPPNGPHASPWYKPEDYQKIVMELDKRGYQVMTHAIGDAATRMVLDSYDKVEKENGPKDRRFRMEHVGNITPQDLPRFAKLHVIADLQPAFCCGPENPARKTNQWQSLEKSGATLVFSSDWPCSWPPDPFAGIQQALSRVARRPGSFDVKPGPPEYNSPDERLTVEQAVKAYTKNSAYARFSDDQIGTLEPGKQADLAVLSQDIFSAELASIGKTKVWMTMVGGKIVFQLK